jgi:hypothetical protein
MDPIRIDSPTTPSFSQPQAVPGSVPWHALLTPCQSNKTLTENIPVVSQHGKSTTASEVENVTIAGPSQNTAAAPSGNVAALPAAHPTVSQGTTGMPPTPSTPTSQVAKPVADGSPESAKSASSSSGSKRGKRGREYIERDKPGSMVGQPLSTEANKVVKRIRNLADFRVSRRHGGFPQRNDLKECKDHFDSRGYLRSGSCLLNWRWDPEVFPGCEKFTSKQWWDYLIVPSNLPKYVESTSQPNSRSSSESTDSPSKNKSPENKTTPTPMRATPSTPLRMDTPRVPERSPNDLAATKHVNSSAQQHGFAQRLQQSPLTQSPVQPSPHNPLKRSASHFDETSTTEMGVAIPTKRPRQSPQQQLQQTQGPSFLQHMVRRASLTPATPEMGSSSLQQQPSPVYRQPGYQQRSMTPTAGNMAATTFQQHQPSPGYQQPMMTPGSTNMRSSSLQQQASTGYRQPLITPGNPSMGTRTFQQRPSTGYQQPLTPVTGNRGTSTFQQRPSTGYQQPHMTPGTPSMGTNTFRQQPLPSYQRMAVPQGIAQWSPVTPTTANYLAPSTPQHPNSFNSQPLQQNYGGAALGDFGGLGSLGGIEFGDLSWMDGALNDQ